MPESRTRKISVIKVIIALIIVAGLSAAAIALNFYKKAFDPNVNLDQSESSYIYIPSGAKFHDVLRIMDESHYLRSSESFRWTAERMKYTEKIKPGRYLLKQDMTNRQLIAMLRSGDQAPVKVTFNNLRTLEQLAGKVARVLEPDSQEFVEYFRDTAILRSLDVTYESLNGMFLPNTYEFYWDTGVEDFANRMKQEYDKFWNSHRMQKAERIGLDQNQVSTIASIVEQETKKNDEKPVVAGVYINRYKKGWKLEADPTLIYALGDFSIRRVLNKHKKIESPYNTYINTGLPPGPICIPSLSSIDAVLNYQQHNYMFFCAREDFSGYHNFAQTYREHRMNAKKFQRELNKRKIKS